MASKHLTPEQENFVQLSIACVDEIRIVLGDILYSQIPAAYLVQEIQSNPVLRTGNQKLSSEQLRICWIPGPVGPNYHSFDITLLYKLIRNLCPKLQPTNGWGLKPHQSAITIGDDIERLRIFRNEVIAHTESSIVPDHIFDVKWNELESIFKRIQGYMLFRGITRRYMEHLQEIKRTCFGLKDYEKSAFLLSVERQNLRDIPKLTLNGDEKTLCGDKACFRLTYEDGDMSNNWPVTWQRITGNKIIPINIRENNYSGSSSQQLVIQRVTKNDEGEYRATVSHQVKGRPIEIPSNSIYLTATGDLPYLKIENAFSKKNRITIPYIVSVNDQSPQVEEVAWTKDGKKIATNTYKYSGGEIGDTYLKICFPTHTDIGRYQCKVSNAVGCVQKHIDLDVPSVSIDEDPEVTIGDSITITATIKSCPTPESAIWQKHDTPAFWNYQILDTNDFKYYGSKYDLGDPRLVIRKTTHDDGMYYRLVVSNGIGESASNTTFLKLLGDVPSLSVHHFINDKEKSITLVCGITTSNDSPKVSEVFWTKDDRKIDILGSGGKYAGGRIGDPSLTIKAVIPSDKGKYKCCASNLIGSMWSETLDLDVPTIEFDNPDIDSAHEKAIYGASIISIPVPYCVAWKVRQDPIGDFQAIYIHDPLYRGSTVALPHPRLVVNKYKTEQLRSYQLEVKNFIGESKKSTQDIAVKISNPSINQEVSNPLRKFYSKSGSGVRFAKLTDYLAESIPEDKLERLKHILFGYDAEVDEESIKKVKSVRELVMLLQEKKLFTKTDVIVMQSLLKQTGCEDLYEKCYQYAKKRKVLCYFGRPPGLADDGFVQVQFHVTVPFEVYSQEEIQKIKETVIAILDCDENDIYIEKIVPTNSFIIVFAIKKRYISKITNIDHQHIQKLSDLKVDYFDFEKERYTTEELLREVSNPLGKLYSKGGSGVMFARLTDYLAESIPENKLERLKHILFGYEEVDEESIKKVKSARELVILLQEKNLFTQTDVIFMQSLLKQTGCEDLYEKCYQYAKKRKALCYFERPPGLADDGFVPVQFHVTVPFEVYSQEEIQKIKETVIAILDCDENDIYIEKIVPTNSFIIVFAIKKRYISKITRIDHQHIQKLSDLKVDYFDFEKERYTTEELLRDVSLSYKPGFPATQISSITVPGVDDVIHISVVTSDRLWVSDEDGRLVQVDSTGHVLHDKQRTRSFYIGSHTVTEDGDLLFIDNHKVYKLTSDGTVTTLLTPDWGVRCIHSSRINGDILVGSILVGSRYDRRVTRYDRTGRELQVIERDDKGQRLYRIPSYITENRNGDIWTSDRDKTAVVVVDKSGRHRFNYTGRQSDDTGRQSRFSPRGICTDVLGHVLVCDIGNDSVHLLDQDGQFLSLLLTREQHGIHRPMALCVDDQHNLYLAQYHSNKINVYKYLQGH